MRVVGCNGTLIRAASFRSGHALPMLAGGFGAMTSRLLLLAMILIRSYGLFGHSPPERG